MHWRRAAGKNHDADTVLRCSRALQAAAGGNCLLAGWLAVTVAAASLTAGRSVVRRLRRRGLGRCRQHACRVEVWVYFPLVVPGGGRAAQLSCILPDPHASHCCGAREGPHFVFSLSVAKPWSPLGISNLLRKAAHCASPSQSWALQPAGESMGSCSCCEPGLPSPPPPSSRAARCQGRVLEDVSHRRVLLQMGGGSCAASRPDTLSPGRANRHPVLQVVWHLVNVFEDGARLRRLPVASCSPDHTHPLVSAELACCLGTPAVQSIHG